MTLTLLLIVLMVVAAYYMLGGPLLDYIHKFTKEFTRTFPLWSFFLPAPAARVVRASASPRRQGAQKRYLRRRGRPT